MHIGKVQRLYEGGQYVAASGAFLDALRDPDVSSPGDLANLYFLGAKIRHKLGNWHSALELARIAEQNAVKAGDANLLGKIWFNLAEFLRTTGDTAEALEYSGKFLDNLGMYPEMAKFAGVCHYNTALCYRQRNDMDGALRHGRLALETVGEAGNPHWIVLVYQNHAWHLLEAGQAAEAGVVLDRAESRIDAENTQGRRQQLICRAYHMYHRKEYEAARMICEEFLVPGATVTEEQRFWALWIAGMMYADIRRGDLAEKFWMFANDSALKTGDPRHLNFAGKLRARFLAGTYPKDGEQ